MTERTSLPSPKPASLGRVLMTLLAAFAVAMVILAVAVLPAEYGIDPTGLGRTLGLMPADAPTASANTAGTAAALPLAGTLIPQPLGATSSYYGKPFATDRVTLEIGPYDYVEYKYRLEQGATMTFAWRASAEVTHDFHADPDGADDHTEVSFDNRRLVRAFGTHTAPLSGLHGWMWENPGSTPITVTLTTAGFYSAATEFRPNRRTIPHAIQPALD